ncbi:MAG: kinase-like domain-containing protein [Linnemannia elongata]|nr:MAG: kinase-like domain-containing protein [Linnemannia elongata]
MADITSTVFNLVTSISSAASRARVNKTACFYLSLQCNEVLRRFENGELGSKTDPKLNELVATLEKCRTHLTKFTGYGWLLRLIRSEDIPSIIEQHSKALEKWTTSVPQVVPEAVLDEEDLEAELFEEGVSRRQQRPEDVPIINPDDLKVGGEVGKFPFGTIHMGIYNRELVYVRKVDEHIKGIPLDLIRGSVRLSGCLVGCHAVLHVHGICQGRMIVTETTTHGPLSDFPIKNTLQKVEIARKVADAIMALHDVDVDGGKKGVVLRDIRAANVLIDKGQNGKEELEPKITGFEMCKRDTYETGEYPKIDEHYRKWWAPETTVSGTHGGSDVYSFGVLMYEISTGREPADGDLVEMEGMRICAEYTNLMKRCLNGRHQNARPKMDEVAQELLSIENIIMGADREP